ncbi:hypothetical protein [Arthrobacter bambusae]|uniref:hypothetical protein n=1 Tax=Arthrobacter bambusae TaxID=1338426 RepID=UPI002789AA2C|nr:hypothetical protein [Arthrobacter bambusae]MDQ0241441.1 hypothetical protein [Arthrobacter bambusae]
MIQQRMALIVPANLSKPVRVELIDTRRTTLQVILDGDLESVTCGDWHVYVNTDAMARNLHRNLRATALLHDVGLDLAGICQRNVIFLGHNEHGYEDHVPGYLIRRAEDLFDTTLVNHELV